MKSTSWRGESPSPEFTEALGRSLGALLPAGSVLSLEGDLGAGKTTFVRGLAQGLGADPDEVSSPTYTLMHEVPGRLTLYHFDAWIQAREQAFLEGGGVEWLLGDGVCAVEWGGGVEAFLPLPRLSVRLRHLGPELRGIEVELVAEGGPGGAPAARADPNDLRRAIAALKTLPVAGEIEGDPEPPADPCVPEAR